MHITADMLRAVDRGEMSYEELSEIMIEHLAEVCPGCAEVLAAYEECLALGEDPEAAREAFMLDFLIHIFTFEEQHASDHHDCDYGPS